jgi:hypothetical protein
MWFSAMLLAAGLAGCGGGGDGGSGTFGNRPTTQAGQGTGVGGNGRGPAPVSLGTSGNFTVLAETAVTSVPTSAITGDVGLSPAAGSAYVLTCPEVVGGGIIYSTVAGGPACETVDATRLTTAIGDKGTAYTDANGRAPDYTELGGGNLGGMNLAPATYKFSTGVLIPTNLTLTGGPNDVWIFQIAQGLTVSPGVQITLAGGALPQNIFWATFAAASLDTTSKFKGTILSQTNIAMQTGATINGKLWAGTGVTLNQNVVGP